MTTEEQNMTIKELYEIFKRYYDSNDCKSHEADYELCGYTGCKLERNIGMSCPSCPINISNFFDIMLQERNNITTRKDEALKLFPNMDIDKIDNLPNICPQNMDNKLNCNAFDGCDKCRKEYWLQPIEKE